MVKVKVDLYMCMYAKQSLNHSAHPPLRYTTATLHRQHENMEKLIGPI